MPNLNVVDQKSFLRGLFFLVENSYYPLLTIISAYMEISITAAVRIADANSRKLTQEQPAFNHLIKSIQKAKGCLQEQHTWL